MFRIAQGPHFQHSGAGLNSTLEKIRDYLRISLDEQRRLRINKFQALRFRNTQHLLYLALLGSNLKALATVYGTDKWRGHRYAEHYEKHFGPLRYKRLNILEIGIGGYEDPELGGNSLRMWRTYFPKSRIYGIDIYEKSLHNERRIKTFKGSQVDENFLDQMIRTIGRVDVIIDDGSHENEHVLFSFKHLFPLLSEKGIYVIEDTQSSYWPGYGGSSDDLTRQDTTMGFLKGLADGLNYVEFKNEKYECSYYDTHIVAMHFYHNIVFIQKGLNV